MRTVIALVNFLGDNDGDGSDNYDVNGDNDSDGT
jgi:hypothetical protein